ncbi:hypothetical protein [Thioclava pacifica]|uniref:Tellurium resistance protein n=1 Tax=Thioclava pacifica DSM 10166 TaxID=1353537 RepID=A0A074JFE8_9RHOB|nr:hypothetical protein [Thioclava pacifica]KEO56361.1 hypothetical protein TP2_02205 [Thioclava pacifica DSM 10166]
MSFAPPKMTPKGLFRRTPPAMFPPVLGLMGLGIAWRRGVREFALPPDLAELFLGAVTLLAVFTLLAYVAKIVRRPGVVTEDLRILPGRAGLAAGVLVIYLVAAALAPYGIVALALFWLGVAVHLGFIVTVIYTLMTGPAEQRRVNPTWQLTFSGWIVGALAAQALGLVQPALAMFWVAFGATVGIWLASINQFAREKVPAPLRPLLAIHLAPAAVIGTVATGFDAVGIAQVMAGLAGLYALVLLASIRWLLAGGFSPLWGAFTFPATALAGCWLAQGGPWSMPGAVVLIAATLIVIPIAIQVFKLWAKGQLAMKTNAAIA